MFARAWGIIRIGVAVPMLVVSLGLSTGRVIRGQSPHDASRAGPLSQPCTYPYKIDWPDDHPVWSFCWVPPNESSGIDGSGLELRNVFYKGKQVLYRAHLPILNVKYDPGGCGGGSLSYRDAVDELAAFEVEPEAIVQPGYAEATDAYRFETVCDHPGFDKDPGFRGIEFKGVVVEKKADRLTLTTEMKVGWYRYVQSWTFRLDGTIEPRIGFTAVTDPRTQKPHNHHAYWRFDFDIDYSDHDLIEEATQIWNDPPSWQILGESTHKRSIVPARKWWRVRDQISSRGYEVWPGARDDWADFPGPADWTVADLWALRYHHDEIDDGGAAFPFVHNGDAVHLDQYLDGESLNGQDVVIWYRVGIRHAGSPECHPVGPTLRPIGSW